MRFRSVAALAATLLYLSPAVTLADQPKTIFEYASEAWALGTVRLSAALNFRNGQLLVFPATITELVHAQKGKPQNIMLVHEVAANDVDPFFKRGDVIFAPIRLLPEESYWRDNLPPTRRHQVMGGRRYVFRGDDIEEVKRILTTYTQGRDSRSHEGDVTAMGAVWEALLCSNEVMRQDAMRYLASSDALLVDFPPKGMEVFNKFIAGTAPEIEKVALVGLAGRAKLTMLTEALEALADRDDRIGAAALGSLTEIGRARSSATIRKLTSAKTLELRLFAYEQMGREAGQDSSVLTTLDKLLASSEPTALKEAAARGLGASGSQAAVEVLAAALARRDDASAAAAEALGLIGGEKAVALLEQAVLDGPDVATVAAISALSTTRDCSDCRSFLVEQSQKHKDEDVRKLISIRMEIPLPREH